MIDDAATGEHPRSHLVADIEMLPKHPVWALIGVIVGWFIVHLVLTQVGELGKMFNAMGEAEPLWLAACILTMMATHIGAGIAEMGSVDADLPFVRTVEVQLAGAAANRLTPAGVGGMGVSVRYLNERGIDKPTAVAAVGLDSAAGIVVHGTLLALVAILVHRSRIIPRMRIPHGWPELVGLGVLAVAIGVILASKTLRHRIASIRPVFHSLTVVVTRPRRALQLFGGSAIITIGNVLAFYAACLSVDADVSLLKVAAVYLAGSAIASAAPTPGGLGAVEAALVAGLSAVHVPLEVAVPSVLIYRVVTFWLPILPGWFIFRSFRHSHVL
ncbi:MAG TPA: lysylphosphatidylglycerol synthase transmembrane domain-containing protein [Acidimicrobiales bacterium]|nr:lysylphosphatidylglycerol synthase transmembrane domain-containing protein [Acidimicrobiales bacterium]